MQLTLTFLPYWGFCLAPGGILQVVFRTSLWANIRTVLHLQNSRQMKIVPVFVISQN